MSNFTFRRAQDQQRATQLRLAEMQRTIPTATSVPWDVTVGTTGSGNPNYTPAVGVYVRANRLLIAWATVTLQAASGGSTGDYLISLPTELAAAFDTAISIGGTWEYHRASNNTEVWGHVFPNPGVLGVAQTQVKLGYLSAYPVGTKAYVGAITPWVPANGDVLHLTVIAKAALGA